MKTKKKYSEINQQKNPLAKLLYLKTLVRK